GCSIAWPRACGRSNFRSGTEAMPGEFELIHRFFDRGPARDARLGVGDDCALLATLDPHSVLAISTDLLLEGRHFFADAEPASLGHKSLAVNLSDLAAMGARP